MKQLLITIAAAVLVGCGSADLETDIKPHPDFVGKYQAVVSDLMRDIVSEKFYFQKKTEQVDLLEDGTFIREHNITNIPKKGKWGVSGSYLIIQHLSLSHNNKANYYNFLDKNTLKFVSVGTYNPELKMYPNDYEVSSIQSLKKVIPLSKCKACKGKVSSEAKVCPHCGQPDPV